MLLLCLLKYFQKRQDLKRRCGDTLHLRRLRFSVYLWRLALELGDAGQADGLRGDITSLNFSQKFAALDHLESVRIYITHGLSGRENQMPRPRISAGAAVFRMAIMDVSVFNHDDIAAIVSQAL